MNCSALTAAAAAVVAATLLNAAGTKPEVYRNEEFGITLPVPEGALRCPIPEDEHDHGPVFLLRTSNAKGCHDLEHNRYIEVFAGYNAVDETKKLHGFLKWECANVAKGACRPPPRDLQIPGPPSAAARVNRPDGWIYVIVVTQAGKPDPAFDASVPSVNYNLSLHTTPKHLEEDLPIFRKVLGTIRLSPPPPPH